MTASLANRQQVPAAERARGDSKASAPPGASAGLRRRRVCWVSRERH